MGSKSLDTRVQGRKRKQRCLTVSMPRRPYHNASVMVRRCGGRCYAARIFRHLYTNRVEIIAVNIARRTGNLGTFARGGRQGSAERKHLRHEDCRRCLPSQDQMTSRLESSGGMLLG